MHAGLIDDRRYYANGIAARYIGTATDAFRPSGTANPLNQANRYMRLDAAFEPAHGGISTTNDYGAAGWHGIFDASYTKPGDYLVSGNRTFFIASQWSLLPILCILTNRVVSIVRPALQTGVGANSYGGYLASGASTLVSNWPASILGIGDGVDAKAGLPNEQADAGLTILLPKAPAVLLSAGDLIADDLGRSILIGAAELTDLGWRLNARLAST